MMNRLSSLVLKSAAVVLALLLSGGHWMILQTAAWVGMITAYSRDQTVSTAIEQTFDGEHPCCLCTLIQKGKQQAGGQELRQREAPSDPTAYDPFFLEAPEPTLSTVTHVAVNRRYRTRKIPPPVPPPRMASTTSVS